MPGSAELLVHLCYAATLGWTMVPAMHQGVDPTHKADTRWLWGRALLAGILLMTVAPPVGAESPRNGESPVPSAAASSVLFDLDYRDAARCGAPAHFVAELQRKSARLRPARPGGPEAWVLLRVTLRRAGPAIEGKLDLVDGRGRMTSREVSGMHCGEVVQALAFIAVMLAEAESENSLSASGDSSADSEADRAGSDPLGWRAGGGVEAVTGPLARVAPAAAIAGAIQARTWQILGMGLFAGPQQFVRQGRVGSLVWTSSRIAPCPIRVGPKSFTLWSCAMVELGVLYAHGERGMAAGWVTPGLQVFGDISVGSSATLMFYGAVGRPLVRSRVRYDPLPVVYQVNELSGSAGLLATFGRFPQKR